MYLALPFRENEPYLTSMKFNRRANARPVELLDAALERFLAVGFAQAKVDDIAAAAGVTVGTVYRYFPSKEALFEQSIARHLDIDWSRGKELSEAYGTMTAREVIALLLHRWSAHLRLPGPRTALVLIIRESATFQTAVQSYTSQLLETGCKAIERALRHGIEREEFPLLPIEATAQGLAAMVVGNAIWEATFFKHLPPLPGQAPHDVTIDLAVRGLPRMGAGQALAPLRSETGHDAAELDAKNDAAHGPSVPSGKVRIRTLRAPDAGAS